jgi:hypothetical protein
LKQQVGVVDELWQLNVLVLLQVSSWAEAPDINEVAARASIEEREKAIVGQR